MYKKMHHIGVVQIDELKYNYAFEHEPTSQEDDERLHSSPFYILFVVDYDDFIKVQSIKDITIDIYATQLRNIAAHIVNIEKIKGKKARFAIKLNIDKEHYDDLITGQQAFITVFYKEEKE
jgi:hypothetical protein